MGDWPPVRCGRERRGFNSHSFPSDVSGESPDSPCEGCGVVARGIGGYSPITLSAEAVRTAAAGGSPAFPADGGPPRCVCTRWVSARGEPTRPKLLNPADAKHWQHRCGSRPSGIASRPGNRRAAISLKRIKIGRNKALDYSNRSSCLGSCT
jgi:hypothetical protein